MIGDPSCSYIREVPQVKTNGPLKTHMLRVRVDPDLRRDLRWAAAKKGTDISTYLRGLAERDIQRLKRGPRRS